MGGADNTWRLNTWYFHKLHNIKLLKSAVIGTGTDFEHYTVFANSYNTWLEYS